MAYKYDPMTGDFVDTSKRSQARTAEAPAPQVRAVRVTRPPAARTTRQRHNPRTAMSTVRGGTSRYRCRKSEYFRWWILRMCVYVGIAMLFNLCGR